MRRRLPVSLALGWRDLKGGARRLRIFVACLALGVAAIAGVGSLAAAVRAGIAADARTLLGGDLELRLAHREIAPEQRSFLVERAQVSEVAQLRAMARRPDDEARRLVYAVVDGRTSHYNAAVEVLPEDDGSRVVWTIDLLPDELAPAIGAMMDQAVGVMKKTLAA